MHARHTASAGGGGGDAAASVLIGRFIVLLLLYSRVLLVPVKCRVYAPLLYSAHTMYVYEYCCTDELLPHIRRSKKHLSVRRFAQSQVCSGYSTRRRHHYWILAMYAAVFNHVFKVGLVSACSALTAA